MQGESGDALTIQTQLEAAFAEDHRQMIRGLSDVVEDLERGEVEAAVRTAEAVDRAAGAHIRFEEEILYREVARSRGHDYASGLYLEHEAVRHGIASLLAHASGKHLDEDLKDRIIAELKVGLDHAVSCGTLVGHLSGLEPGRQKAMLDRLLELRSSGVRWSELPRTAL